MDNHDTEDSTGNVSMSDSMDDPGDQNVDKKKQPVQCELCGEWKPSIVSYQTHMFNEHDKLVPGAKQFKCPTCEKILFSKAYLDTHKYLAHVDKKPLTCQFCGKVKYGIHAISDHINQVHKAARFVCELCGQTCVTNSRLKLHIKEKHERYRPFICQVADCSGSFFRRKTLEIHVKNVHEKVKDFVCSWESCGKSFHSGYSVKRHELLHSGDKPIGCPHCKYTCRQTSSLKFHLRKHHPGSAETTGVKRLSETSNEGGAPVKEGTNEEIEVIESTNQEKDLNRMDGGGGEITNHVMGNLNSTNQGKVQSNKTTSGPLKSSNQCHTRQSPNMEEVSEQSRLSVINQSQQTNGEIIVVSKSTKLSNDDEQHNRTNQSLANQFQSSELQCDTSNQVPNEQRNVSDCSTVQNLSSTFSVTYSMAEDQYKKHHYDGMLQPCITNNNSQIKAETASTHKSESAKCQIMQMDAIRIDTSGSQSYLVTRDTVNCASKTVLDIVEEVKLQCSTSNVTSAHLVQSVSTEENKVDFSDNKTPSLMTLIENSLKDAESGSLLKEDGNQTFHSTETSTFLQDGSYSSVDDSPDTLVQSIHLQNEQFLPLDTSLLADEMIGEENGASCDNISNDLEGDKIFETIIMCPCCPICGIVLSNKKEYNKHQKLAHGFDGSHENEPPTRRPDDVNLPPSKHDRTYIMPGLLNSSLPVKSFPCTICGHNTLTQNDYYTHLHTEHSALPKDVEVYPCSVCGKLYFSKDAHDKHGYVHSGRLPCKVCGKMLKPSYLAEHEKNVHSNYRFHCEICGQRCQNKSRLRFHVAEKHEKAKRFSCPVEGCAATFLRLVSYREHTDSVHNKIREYKCTKEGCQKAFSRSNHLRRHLLIHSGEKPIKCRHCDYTCRQNVLLKRHMGKVHNCDIYT